MKLIGILLFIASLAPTAWSADLTGRWKGEFKLPNGRTREMNFALKSEGGEVTGYEIQRAGDDPIVEGSVKGDEFTFVVSTPNLTAGERKTTYKGKLAGDQLQIARGKEVVTLHRVSSAAPGPIHPLPPPDLPAVQPLKDNGLARTPPMGWNSWNYFQSKVSDKVVREIADAIVSSGMKKAGYRYINIDDTWEGGRDANGNITTNEKFPDMKKLADYVHKKGLKIGIYSSPGPRTCAGYEASYGHEAQDAKTFAAWGMDYLKYDWCSASRVYKETDMPAAYQKMAEALRATGRPIVYSLCQYGKQDVWKWGGQAGGNLWRTTGDIRDTWDSMTDLGFEKQQGLEKFAGPGRWNDPDMLEIGNGGMSDIEYRTHMSMWSILAAPLLAGNDLRSMSAATRAILLNAEVIAVNQDKLGKQGYRVAKDGDAEVWVRPLAGGAWAIGLFNRGTSPRIVKAAWSDFGASGSLKLRDLWAHADRGAAQVGYSAEVPAHGGVLLRAKR